MPVRSWTDFRVMSFGGRPLLLAGAAAAEDAFLATFFLATFFLLTFFFATFLVERVTARRLRGVRVAFLRRPLIGFFLTDLFLRAVFLRPLAVFFLAGMETLPNFLVEREVSSLALETRRPVGPAERGG